MLKDLDTTVSLSKRSNHISTEPPIQQFMQVVGGDQPRPEGRYRVEFTTSAHSTKCRSRDTNELGGFAQPIRDAISSLEGFSDF